MNTIKLYRRVICANARGLRALQWNFFITRVRNHTCARVQYVYIGKTILIGASKCAKGRPETRTTLWKTLCYVERTAMRSAPICVFRTVRREKYSQSMLTRAYLLWDECVIIFHNHVLTVLNSNVRAVRLFCFTRKKISLRSNLTNQSGICVISGISLYIF